ncbi:FecR family protein [Botrimarina sp.]|uniref:FecR family protein n=1 Tax=Botrimarina sp. TaxID=2795802 RepID=UPI0032ECB1C1
MTADYEPSDELGVLIQRVVDGQLTDAEHDRLEAILSDDAAAREFFADFLRLHGLLNYQAVATCPNWEEFESRWAQLDPPAGDVDVESGLISGGARTRFAAYCWRLAPWGVAAALVLSLGLPKGERADKPPAVADAGSAEVTTGVQETPGQQLGVKADDPIVLQSVSRPPAPVATLASHSDAIWRGKQLSVGEPMHEGETFHLEEGNAHISVGFGAEIKATGPCSLTFTSNDQVRLSQGEILVDVAEWAKGFTVVTDAMDVVDLGTTFSVSAGDGLATKTSVLSGMVRALPRKTPEGDRRSILLSEGEGLAVDGEGNRRSFKRPSKAGPDDPRFDGPAPYRPVTLYNTGIGLAEGDEDPHWRVIAGPADAFDGACYARVCVPYKRYLDNELSSSQWVSIPGWESAAPNSMYTFATAFDLDGYDLATTRLFGRFLADNGIQAVRVNGQSVRVESWTDNVSGQRFDGQQFRFVNVTDGLVDGRNTIEIDVFNGTTVDRETYEAVVVPNHMALRVEWYAFGRGSELASVRGEDTKPATTAAPTSHDSRAGATNLRRESPRGFHNRRVVLGTLPADITRIETR